MSVEKHGSVSFLGRCCADSVQQFDSGSGEVLACDISEKGELHWTKRNDDEEDVCRFFFSKLFICTHNRFFCSYGG